MILPVNDEAICPKQPTHKLSVRTYSSFEISKSTQLMPSCKDCSHMQRHVCENNRKKFKAHEPEMATHKIKGRKIKRVRTHTANKIPNKGELLNGRLQLGLKFKPADPLDDKHPHDTYEKVQYFKTNWKQNEKKHCDDLKDRVVQASRKC